MFYKSIVLLVGCVLAVYSFSDGVPDSVCNNGGVPNHASPYYDVNTAQAKETNPYHVVATSHIYEPGSIVLLNIKSHGAETFKGFFFQAFDTKSGDVIGNWEKTKVSRLVTACSGISHTTNQDKNSIILIWKYNGNGSGELLFRGTIVQNFQIFWTHIIATVYYDVESFCVQCLANNTFHSLLQFEPR